MVKSSLMYHDSTITDYQMSQLGINIDSSFSITEFLEKNCDHKLSCYHVPFPSDNDWLKRFSATYQQCDHTFVFCSELHDSTVEQLISLDKENVSLLICGFINFKFKFARVYQWMDWFTTTREIYQKIDILEKLTPYNIKSKYFDVLLGQPREHREYVKNKILKNKLDSDIILTSIKSQKPLIELSESDWIWEEGIKKIDPKAKYTVSTVEYHGHSVSISQIIPISIYNKTAYTLVTETNFSNHYSFYTEKTVKPILAKRLFVVISGQYFLRNLRKLGFKTFDGIIDESYDLESDHAKRFDMAIEQMQYLINCPQEQILEKIKPITEHNQKLMLNQNWSSSMQDLVAHKDL